MANRNDPNAPRSANEPVTAPDRDRELPRQSEVNATHGRARESGRSAAKWIGIILAAIIALLILAALFGGGAWIWGPTDGDAAVEEAG